MSTATCLARLGLLEISNTALRFALIAIEYDYQRAVDQAVRNGRADWAHALSTGTHQTTLASLAAQARLLQIGGSGFLVKYGSRRSPFIPGIALAFFATAEISYSQVVWYTYD